MARKFIDLDEAAQMLGVSSDTLREMRERGKVHGYRDGASWKFKQEEIERVIADREAAEEEGEFAEVDEDPDSILLSEVELGQSDESTSSTIIGGRKNPDAAAASESDIQLAASESDIQLAAPKSDSDVNLDSALTLDSSEGSDVLGGSDVQTKSGSGVSPLFDELDTLDLDLPSAADSGISSKIYAEKPDAKAEGGSVLGSDKPVPEGSGLGLASEDELALEEAPEDEASSGDDEEIQLEDPGDGGSAIDLTGDVDDDLVLGGSSHGDLSRTGDSGISLMDPSDSGLSLETAPPELGGSAVDSLDLGDDDMILTEDEADAGEAEVAADADDSDEIELDLEAESEPEVEAELDVDEQSDDDFLLTPLEEASAEESDSGSQVIALDDDVEFEEADAPAATLEDEGGLMEDDLGEGFGAAPDMGSAGLEPAPTAGAATSGAPAAAATAPEAPFSTWNVVSLGLCAVLLAFCGMFMFDLLRNMWSWNGEYSVNSSMMDVVLSWF